MRIERHEQTGKRIDVVCRPENVSPEGIDRCKRQAGLVNASRIRLTDSFHFFDWTNRARRSTPVARNNFCAEWVSKAKFGVIGKWCSRVQAHDGCSPERFFVVGMSTCSAAPSSERFCLGWHSPV